MFYFLSLTTVLVARGERGRPFLVGLHYLLAVFTVIPVESRARTKQRCRHNAGMSVERRGRKEEGDRGG